MPNLEGRESKNIEFKKISSINNAGENGTAKYTEMNDHYLIPIL